MTKSGIDNSQRIVVAISGATGSIYGIRLLEVLKERDDIETHLIISKPALRIMKYETDCTVEDCKALADYVYDVEDIGASLSSGSFITSAMVVAPCSMKSASGIANSYNDTLLIRAADVTLKEKRKLVLLVRETPLHLGHLRLLTQLAEMGAIIMPPLPAFYNCPKTLDDIVNHTVGKVLDMLMIKHELFSRWPPSLREESPVLDANSKG